MSYADTADAAPFAGLAGESFAEERFLDAEVSGPLGSFGEAGYTASLHDIRPAGDGDSAPIRTAGGRFWLSGFQDRLLLDSSIALNGDETIPTRSLAQRHQVTLVPLRFGATELSTTLSFSETGADFHAQRSGFGADTRTLSLAGKLKAGQTTLEVGFTKSRNNVDNRDDKPTSSWRDLNGALSWSLSAPSVIPYTVAASGGFREEGQSDSDQDKQIRRIRRWGLNMRWGNPNAYGGLDLLGSFGVKRSRGAGTEADRQHRLALEGGLKNQRGKLETAIFATRKRMNTGIGGDTSSDVGWSLSAEVIGLTLESLVKKRVLSDPEQSRPWTWTVGAEIDALRLMAGRGFSEPWFALAKIEAEVGDIGNETVTDYQTMLSAGLRF